MPEKGIHGTVSWAGSSGIGLWAPVMELPVQRAESSLLKVTLPIWVDPLCFSYMDIKLVCCDHKPGKMDMIWFLFFCSFQMVKIVFCCLVADFLCHLGESVHCLTSGGNVVVPTTSSTFHSVHMLYFVLQKDKWYTKSKKYTHHVQNPPEPPYIIQAMWTIKRRNWHQ